MFFLEDYLFLIGIKSCGYRHSSTPHTHPEILRITNRKLAGNTVNIRNKINNLVPGFGIFFCVHGDFLLNTMLNGTKSKKTASLQKNIFFYFKNLRNHPLNQQNPNAKKTRYSKALISSNSSTNPYHQQSTLKPCLRLRLISDDLCFTNIGSQSAAF